MVLARASQNFGGAAHLARACEDARTHGAIGVIALNDFPLGIRLAEYTQRANAPLSGTTLATKGGLLGNKAYRQTSQRRLTACSDVYKQEIKMPFSLN